METLIIYVNDSDDAKQQLAVITQGHSATKCVLVACPPRLNRHISKWISGAARKRWQAQWAATTCSELAKAFSHTNHQFVTRVAYGPLITVTKQLQGEFANARVLDARRTHLAQVCEPITENQRTRPDLTTRAMGVAATTAILALAAD